MTGARTVFRAVSAGVLACVLGAAAPVRASDKGTLVIWINGDKGYEGIARIGEKFTRETGVPVRVEHPEGAKKKFEQSAAAGRGPDIWIWPQDGAGGWISSGLIDPVTPSAATKRGIDPLAWQAWSIGGKLWAYPLAIEAMGLIYNKDLVATPPRTWEQVLTLDRSLARQGRHAIMWSMSEIYYSWGIVFADNGYAFRRRADGTYDTSDTSIDTPGARRGVETLLQLVHAGAIPKTATYAEAEAAFNEGRVAMTINGPWSWNNLRKSRINFGVALFPTVDGKQGGPLYGVLGAMISSASKNKELANEFLENYLMSLEALRAMNAHVPLGVPANKAYFDELKGDPLIAGGMAVARSGSPMPNNPEMTRFWVASQAALDNITQGRETVSVGLARAASRITGRGADAGPARAAAGAKGETR